MHSKNYQFLNKDVVTESMVCLAIETDLDFNLDYANAAENTDIKFKITKISKDRHIIKKIKSTTYEFII